MRTRESTPSLKRAGIVFVATVAIFVAIGLAIQSWNPDPAEKVVTVKSPPATTERYATRSRAKIETIETPRPEVTPVAVETPVVDSAAVEGEASDVVSEPVRYADAESAYLEKNYERSAELFARFTEENPGHLWGHYMNGLALRRLGRLDEAGAELTTALEIVPDHGKSLVNLGRVLLDAERPADALPHLERAVEARPDDVDAQRVRARALHSLGRVEEALAGYTAALAIDENDAWSLNNMGLILIEQERFEEARVPLVKACAADEQNATCRNNLGVALERSGDPDGARDAFAEALALDPEHERAKISLARVEAHVVPVDPVETEAALAVASPAAEATEAVEETP